MQWDKPKHSSGDLSHKINCPTRGQLIPSLLFPDQFPAADLEYEPPELLVDETWVDKTDGNNSATGRTGF